VNITVKYISCLHSDVQVARTLRLIHVWIKSWTNSLSLLSISLFRCLSQVGCWFFFIGISLTQP
jgi:hypothetical protein